MLLITLPLFTACDIHEWPTPLEIVPVHVKLSYNGKDGKGEYAKWDQWLHTYEGSKVTEEGKGEREDEFVKSGSMRYVLRIYPRTVNRAANRDYIKEIVVTKDISDDYDFDFNLDVPPGKYSIMLWSDFLKDGKESYYDCDDFSEITLNPNHEGNTDLRDAFRGVRDIEISSNYVNAHPDEYTLDMQRPLAKFEFITNDLEMFIENEITRLSIKNNGEIKDSENAPETRVNINDYKVVFYYVGFMPNTYNMNTDKPVDSSTGVFFESTLKRLNENEASVGFDYVFVNGTESAVTVQIGLYDNEETLISLTSPIKVPLRRSNHTILTGKFLTSKASGGLSINPEFDGEFNLVIP